MAGKKHSKGRYFSYKEREANDLAHYRSHETLCGLLFKLSDRNPFAETEEDVTCQWCQKIMNKQEVAFNVLSVLKQL